MDYDSHQATEQARARLDLRRILEQNGSGPRGAGQTWKKFACPWCQHDAAGVHAAKGKPERFKCFHKPCPTENQSMDEAGLIARFHGLSREDAWKTWLKEAGVWREADRLSPSVLAKQRRKHPLPAVPPDPAALPEASPEASPMPPSSTPAIAPGSPTDAGSVEPGRTELPPAGADACTASAPAPSSEPLLSSPEAAGTVVEAAGATDAAAPAAAPDNVVPLPAAGVNGVETRARLAALSGGGAEEDAADDDDEPVGPLQAFYDQLVLTPDDRQALLEKRGLETMADFCGFKSNIKSNRQILEQLEKDFELEALAKCGLWVKRDEEFKPNTQFYGWGIIGKKKAQSVNEDGAKTEQDFDWGWCYPILIPYFDAAGKVTALRPHKGMRKREEGGRPRLYVVRQGGQAEPIGTETVVISEGEFKAAAIKEILPEVAAASMPGINMAKFPPVQEELIEWLRRVSPRKVIIAYDNEEKADKRLPSYKPDPSRRHQTQIWARFLAGLLAARGFNALVAWLPVGWRDEKGKADWDGALARLRKGELACV